MTNKPTVPGAWAFLLAAFFNAFLDLGHKILVQNTLFKVYDGSEQVVYTAILNGLILLPFILLLSPSGYISDRFAKHKVMKFCAYSSLVLAIVITVAYSQGWFWLAFVMTFVMAIQSAFYSPAKYGYIKELFGKERLTLANGWVQAVSIGAILLGTFFFSLGFESLFKPTMVDKSTIVSSLVPMGWVLIAISVLEIVVLSRLPERYEGNPDRRFSLSGYLSLKQASDLLKPLSHRIGIRQSMIGLAMFWSIGQVLLVAFPAFAKSVTGETNTVLIQGVFAFTAIGIALGSWIAGKLSKHHIEMGLVPLGSLGFAVTLLIIPFLTSLTALSVVFLLMGLMGGLFIVPLNALIQFHSGKEELGQMIAVNNFVQNLAMLLFLVGSIVATYFLGVSPTQLLIFTAFVALSGCLYTLYRLPHSLIRFLLSFMVSQRYRVMVQGMSNIPSNGGVLMLGNHISWIDWAIIQIASPRPVRFVMLKSIYNRWYLTWFFKLFKTIPISQGPSSKDALQAITQLLNDGEVTCLFPEGSISRNGQLGEFRRGYEKAIEQANASTVILPFYLRGLWGSPFSRSSDRLKQQRKTGLRRDIVVAFGSSLPKDTPTDALKQAIFDLSIESWQAYAQDLPTLGVAWIRSVKRQPGGLAMVDGNHKPLSPAKALATASVLSNHIKASTHNESVGLLLPTSLGGILANMAVVLSGKTLVNLNYTASSKAIKHAITFSDIDIIYSSKRFVKKLEQKGLDPSQWLEGKQVVYLEDLFESISKRDIVLRFLTIRLLPSCLLERWFSTKTKPADTAVIIYTSGSEGLPKGVQLTHTNILANLKQISDVLDTQEDDCILASLPLFHAFGLTVTQFMPLIESIPLVCHPDPTDAPGLAKMVAQYRATIMCSTSTFLRLYCKNSRVQPLMFDSLRLVVAGAERLNPSIRDAFILKFNTPIYEGYGATETTPVASVNIPDRLSISDWKTQQGNKLGTVGLPLPGTSFKIVDPTTFDTLPIGEAGMILVGGAQVMKGYLNNKEKTNEVIKTIDGIRWYVTGDKGFVDADGFLTIVDRYSRFAKVGGEMISLSAVEAAIFEALPANDELELIAVNLPDDKKGEQVVVLINQNMSHAELKKQLLANSVNPLFIPSNLIVVDEVPKLGSGKTDVSQAKKMAADANIEKS